MRRHPHVTLPRALATLAACGAALAAPACHAYRPLGGAAPPPQAVVRVRLTESGTAALAGYVGPAVVALVGRYEGRSDSGVVLRVESSESRHSVPREWRGELVTVPAAYVAATERRTLSPARTAFLVGGIVAALVGTRVALGGDGSVHPPPVGGGGPR